MASNPAAYLHFGEFDSYGRLDFDKKEIRKGMRRVGALVSRTAKALVKRRGERSVAGQYPARQSGLLYRSIRAKVSRPGFLVKIAPQKIAGMKDFYPAYLHHGVKRGQRLSRLRSGEQNTRKRRREGIRLRAGRRNNAWLIEPRGNFMADALESKSSAIQQLLRQAFTASLN